MNCYAWTTIHEKPAQVAMEMVNGEWGMGNGEW